MWSQLREWEFAVQASWCISAVVCVAEVTGRASPCQQNHSSDTIEKETVAAAAEPAA